MLWHYTFTPSILPIHREIWIPSSTWLLGPTESTTQAAPRSVKPFLQGSAVTDWATDTQCYSVCNNRLHLANAAMSPNISRTPRRGKHKGPPYICCRKGGLTACKDEHEMCWWVWWSWRTSAMKPPPCTTHWSKVCNSSILGIACLTLLFMYILFAHSKHT